MEERNYCQHEASIRKIKRIRNKMKKAHIKHLEELLKMAHLKI